MTALAGKVAVVTGAAGGICAAIVRRFAAAGARVACVDLAAPTALADEVGGIAIAADVSREADTLAAGQAAIAKWGAVHILVNGAAPYDPSGSVLDLRSGRLGAHLRGSGDRGLPDEPGGAAVDDLRRAAAASSISHRNSAGSGRRGGRATARPRAR